MWKTHLRIALRSLRRQRGYALLNGTGLALGLACVLLVGLYVQDERAYDRFHPSAGQIVRVSSDLTSEGQTNVYAESQGLLAPALEADLPEVAHAVRLMGGDFVFRVDGQPRAQTGVYYADSTFFQVFDGFRMLQGNPATALATPGALVLTETLARAYFGTTDVLGQTLQNGAQTLTVTGVMADVPPQTHLPFTALVSLVTAEDPGWYYTNWRSVNFLTYARLRPGTNLAAFQGKLPALVQRRAGAELRDAKTTVALHAEPLTDLHLRTLRGPRTGDAGRLRALGAVALFVLLIACFNFTNLATARSTERAREVGVRKALGAGRGGLIAGFLVEAVVLSTLSLGVALALVALVLPGFALVTAKAFTLGALGAWIGPLLGLAVLAGLGAGAYPALVLAGFAPVQVLRGRFGGTRRGVRLRTALVVMQFASAVALLAATAGVFAQVRFMQHRDLGFDTGSGASRLVTLDFGGDAAVQQQLNPLLAGLRAHPAVLGAAVSLTVPVAGHPSAGGEIERPEGGMRDFSVEAYLVDTAFVNVYGMRLIAGQKPGTALASDSLAGYVLNETAVRAAGYASPEAALGKRALFWGNPGEVIGVVRDFHTRGLQAPVEPLALVVQGGYEGVVTVRVRAEGLPATMQGLETIWRTFAPTRPFDPSFLDAAFGAQYAAERRFGQVFGGFALLAVVIACLGLFGLAALTAVQRTKEIGVRKVLGASVPQLVGLLTRSTLGLGLAATALGVPLAAWGLGHWLDGFAYRVTLGPGLYAGAALAVLAVALLTVSTQALRAATADPIKALRSE